MYLHEGATQTLRQKVYFSLERSHVNIFLLTICILVAYASN